MKKQQHFFFFLIFTLAQVGWSTAQSSYDCTGLDDGFYPAEPNKCLNNYITCTSGIGYDTNCLDPDSLFDPILLECSCSCTELTSTPVDETTTTPVDETTTPLSPCLQDGFFPIAPGVCSPNFYLCIGGVPYLEECPAETGTVFDPESSTCVLPENCPYNSLTTTIPFECPEPYGFFPADPTKCIEDYYSCVNNIAYPKKCNLGSLFDPNALLCSNECSVTNRLQSGSWFSCPEASGLFPDSVIGDEECKGSYFSCDGGTASRLNCPGTSVFHPKMRQCVESCGIRRSLWSYLFPSH